MESRDYLTLLIETVPGYRGYETIEAKSGTDALVRERCSVAMNRIRMNLEQCRGSIISAIGADASELTLVSWLIQASKELMFEITGQGGGEEAVTNVHPQIFRSRLCELDRNILELVSQLDQISQEALASLVAADENEYAERVIILQRGIEHLRKLWQEREVLLHKLRY